VTPLFNYFSITLNKLQNTIQFTEFNDLNEYVINYSDSVLNMSTVLLYNTSEMTTPLVNAAVNEECDRLFILVQSPALAGRQ